MLDEFDDKANVLGAKGVGELGICGAGAAVANAVYNACGVRVREPSRSLACARMVLAPSERPLRSGLQRRSGQGPRVGR